MKIDYNLYTKNMSQQKHELENRIELMQKESMKIKNESDAYIKKKK